jgi:hypothetical protein
MNRKMKRRLKLMSNYYTLKDIFRFDSEHPFYTWYNIWDGISDTAQGFLSNINGSDLKSATNYLLDPLVNR